MTPLLMEEVRYRSLGRLSIRVSSREKVVLVISDPSLDRFFLQLATGLLIPEEGVVELFGVGTTDPTVREKLRSIGILASPAGLVSNLKAVENVMLPVGYHLGARRRDAYQKALQLLDATGYGDHPAALVADLSPLDQRRVALARAVAVAPPLLVWKDAEKGLAPEEVGELCETFFRLFATIPEGTALCVTHEPELFEPFADRIVYG